MNIFDLLAYPGALLGCLVGIGIAALLHWVFPSYDLVILQAIVIVLCTVTGLALEHRQ